MSESPFGFFDVLRPGGKDVEKKPRKRYSGLEQEDPLERSNLTLPERQQRDGDRSLPPVQEGWWGAGRRGGRKRARNRPRRRTEPLLVQAAGGGDLAHVRISSSGAGLIRHGQGPRPGLPALEVRREPRVLIRDLA